MYQKMVLKLLLVFGFLLKSGTAHVILDWETVRPAFDPQFYEDQLDPEACQKQLGYITNLSNTMLRLQFLEAGMKFPRGFLQGNNLDMGNYYQCLGINKEIEDSVIEGKYCLIQGSIGENFANLAKAVGWQNFDPDVHLTKEVFDTFDKVKKVKRLLLGASAETNGSRTIISESPLGDAVFRLAVCVPKVCTTHEGLSGLLYNISSLGFNYKDEFCRVNNDKPWVPADYVAIAVFSVIGLLTILSTAYDLWYIFVKKDPKAVSTLYQSFSVYTNTRRLTTITSRPGTLECVDGVRMLAMLWIIVGHAHSTLPSRINAIDEAEWLFSLRSLWITAAPYTVDTFLVLTGVLIVYTTAGKLSGMTLLKNLHMFYLNRLLRMFPLLATIVLLQASVLHRISDGPIWNIVAYNTNNCRKYWWTTLLYWQNYLTPGSLCITHSWYLAIDMHLHIISPIILFWVLSGKKASAWMALTAGVLASWVVLGTYTFINQFQGWTFAQLRPTATDKNYHMYFYFNTWTRAPPFFVGMVFGYLLHIFKGKKVKIPVFVAVIFWICTVVITSGLMYVTHEMKFPTWDYWLVDDLLNTFGKSLWALAVGWVIFGCQQGYGGPINWFLSLHLWKLPSRISYAMYIFHYKLQFVVSATATAPIYFSEFGVIYEFLSQLMVTLIVSFLATVLIDSPFSTIFKVMLGDGPKKPPKQVADKE